MRLPKHFFSLLLALTHQSLWSLSPGAKGGDPLADPRVCYGSWGGCVLGLRSGLDQVAAHVAFGLLVGSVEVSLCLSVTTEGTIIIDKTDPFT